MPLMVDGVQVDIKASNTASPVIKQVAADIQGLEQSAKSAGSGIGEANSQTQNWLATTRDVGVSVAAWGFVFDRVMDSAAAVYEFAKSGAQLELVETRFGRLADSIGTTSDALMIDLKEATRGLYTDAELMKSATDLMALGLAKNHDEAVRLASVSAGLNMNMNQLVLTLTNMTTMRFDALGVSVDGFKEKVKALEEQGYSTDEAFREAFLQQAEEQLQKVGHAADTAAGSFMELEARTQNYRDELSKTFSDGIEPSIEAFLDLADAMDEASEATGMTDQRSRIYLGAMQLEMQQQQELEDRINETATARWNGLAALEATYQSTIAATDANYGWVESLAFATVADADAVKGAMQVQDMYEKHSEKLADLQLDHDALLVKKQELMDMGWLPESEKIQSVNEKLAENEQAQKDVTAAMQGTLQQMLLNTAAAGLDAEAQLALARATGQIDEAAYAALSVQQALKKQYDDGMLTAQDYADRTMALRDAIARLESKKVTITVDAILNEIRNSFQNTVGAYYSGLNSGQGNAYGYAEGTDGWMTVPPGYPNDDYPITLTSGERFAVIPAGMNAAPTPAGGFGGGQTMIQLVINSPVTIMDEEKAVNTLIPLLEQAWNELRSRGSV